jgi:type IV pilus assembly protein PilY1
MKKTLITMIIAMAAAAALSNGALAAPDQYSGDTSMYGGATAAIQPNVLFIIDDSGSMADTVPSGSIYDHTISYPQTSKWCFDSSSNPAYCTSTGVYSTSDQIFNTSVTNVTTSCGGANPQNILQTTGQYNGQKLNSNGSCAKKGNSTYYLGNYINWLKGPGLPEQKIVIAKSVVNNFIASTNGVRFGLMTYHYSSGNGYGGQLVSASVSGQTFVSSINNMDDIFTGTTTYRTALQAAVNTLTPTGNTPLGDSLFEAGLYFQGAASGFGNTIGITSGKYTSPITSSCQKNYIVLVTDGMSNADNNPTLSTIHGKYGNYDGGGCTNPPYTTCSTNNQYHVVAGAAKYLYETDLRSDLDGVQNVTTFAIGFGDVGADQEAVDLLNLTTDKTHGRGQTFLAANATALSSALTQVISQIFSVDTSFVAPVVPVSPENRTYSSQRVYMGFFRPVNGTYWDGNLKKYGLDSNNNITDKNGNIANYVDVNGDGIDDNTGIALPSGATNGTFKGSSTSFWSSVADAGSVDEGGAGQVLLDRTTPRNIYTFTGTNTSLTDNSNAFSTTNTAITAATLSVATSTDKDALINFILGFDSYDENLNGNTTEKRAWILSDILHSKPVVVNYASYTFNTSNESNCGVNKSVVYVGDDDGMLHAFNDCNGSEAWAFIPPDLLGNLHYIPGQTHTYFVDSSPSVYIYDANKDGNISGSDKVILIIGLRRGGGGNAVPATGAYYALDVSNPLVPIFLWSVSNMQTRIGTVTTATTTFSELAESWSEPKIVKMRINNADKIVAVIGAGYDNLNEDGRYGATQSFTGTGAVVSANTGADVVTSPVGGVPLGSPVSPKGRGIYAIEVATLSSGVPSLTASGTRIWGYIYGASTNESATPATNSGMAFSFPGEIAAIDTNSDGYIDRLYAVDTGGNLWRFDVGDQSTSNWRGKKLFSPNPGSGGAADVGRKSFYKPTATLEQNYAVVYYGTGDREHPLNRAVVDRIYAVKDKGQTTPKSESDLLDVTADQLQTTTIASGSGSIADILSQLDAASNYGWYIQLNQHAGEKVLAPPTLFSKTVYFTTYAPSTVTVTDPCQPANLGTS